MQILSSPITSSLILSSHTTAIFNIINHYITFTNSISATTNKQEHIVIVQYSSSSYSNRFLHVPNIFIIIYICIYIVYFNSSITRFELFVSTASSSFISGTSGDSGSSTTTTNTTQLTKSISTQRNKWWL
ncbi:hypothetical protein ACTFIW_011169 [Dictyostelium discoideum]